MSPLIDKILSTDKQSVEEFLKRGKGKKYWKLYVKK